MRRILGIGGAIAIIAIAIAIWRCRGDASDSAAPASSPAATVAPTGARVDPRTLARGSISGTVRDDKGAAIASAHVCTSFTSPALPSRVTRDPICVDTNASGAYRIANLLAARYSVAASAPHRIPAAFTAKFSLAAGEDKTGVDIALRAGGVEVTGTVVDVSGGPIAGARVTGAGHDDAEATVTSDAAGKFSLWLEPGTASVSAVADGYTDEIEYIDPPTVIELRLTPESSISGVVIDEATNKPRAGVNVVASSLDAGLASDTTDEEGRFRIDRLVPARYAIEARAPDGLAHEASRLVGLGQQLDGIVLKMRRAYRIAGTVMTAGSRPCESASATITCFICVDQLTRTSVGVDFDGLTPGTYDVVVSCDGHYIEDKLAPITIVDRDITNLTWTARAGGTIRGHVRTKSGAPVPYAYVTAMATKPPVAGVTGHAMTDASGEFHVTGLRPAAFKVQLSTVAGRSTGDFVAEVAANATVEHDFVIDDAASVAGIVVDRRGAPIANVHVGVRAEKPTSTESWSRFGLTHTDGTFLVGGLEPGDHHLTLLRRNGALRTVPDRPDGVPLHVELGPAATLRIVVEDELGEIAGTVVDEDGNAIGDAYVSARAEALDAPDGPGIVDDLDPVLASTDGSFRIAKLAPGQYTLRAFRRGGGHVVVPSVQLGERVRLQIAATGSIEGTVRHPDGSGVDDFAIVATTNGEFRVERMLGTSGRFVLTDLAAATYEVAIGNHPTLKRTITLVAGRRETDVDFVIPRLVSVTGRLVELGTSKPLAGVMLYAGGATRASTGADGRFTIANVDVGPAILLAYSPAWHAMIPRTIPTTAPTTFDLGELTIPKSRLAADERGGTLGITWRRDDHDAFADDRVEVSMIDPAGPAAKTELRVGDRIERIDGVDVSHGNAYQADVLLLAPAGTRFTLELARGLSVTITSAPLLDRRF